jgi:TonB family protein
MNTRQIDKHVVDGRKSIVIESTLPPTASREILEGEGATILVYSHDATLARVIRSVAADRYPIRIINEWNDLLKQIGSGKGRILLLDVDAVSDNVEEAIADVNRCADWLVTVIAAKQQQAQDLMRFWSERRIHRLLIKPAAAGITRLLLESAFARFIELRELHENTDSMEIPHELIAAERARQRRWLWPFGGAVGVAVIALGVWLSGIFETGQNTGQPARVAVTETLRDDPPAQSAPRASEPQTSPVAAISDPVPEVAEPVAEVAAPAAKDSADAFENQLDLALAAELVGAFVEPPGNNALDHYAAILRDAPEHAIARARLDAIIEDQFARAQGQILQNELDAAEITLEHIERGNPPGSRLAFLRQQLRQMRESAAELERARDAVSASPPPAGQAPVPELSSAPSELQSMLTLTRLRLAEGLLVQPSGDSARDYLLRALDLGVAPADIQDLAEQFVAGALESIPQALSAQDFEAADAMLSTARTLGSQVSDLAVWEAQIQADMLARSAEADRALHAQALLRIDNGAYMGEEDSAIALLKQLRERTADAALITDLEARLANALTRSAREAIAASRWNEADTLLAGFEMASLELPVIQSLTRDLDIARRQAGYLTETAPIGELTLLESAQATYPRLARANDVTGWVDLQFTVDTNGETQNIEVVASEPPGQFENSAISALSRYRFVPFEREGHVYARRARLRMRFQLD